MLATASRSPLLTSALLGLGLALAAPAARADTTITAVMHAPLRAVDPGISTAYIVRDYAYLVYDTLLARDSHGEIRPQMADWKVSDDGRTYIFTLRDGLKWHDGTPVTSADCIASLKRWSQVDKLGQVMAKMLVEMKPIDTKSFAMTFSAPTQIGLLALSKPSGLAPFILPEKVAETPVSQAITSTIGSGPFRFVASAFKPGVEALFDKNTDYVPRREPTDDLAGGKVVHVDHVKWTSMPDSMTAANALMSGEVDMIEQYPPDLLALVKDNPDFEITDYSKQAAQSLMRLNFVQPPFDNPKIRRAALLAVGQQPVLDAQMGAGSPYGHTCAAVFGCPSPYASDYGADDIVKSHPAEAKKLLAEAGYDGKPVLLMNATDIPSLAAIGPVIAQQLRAGGFNVDLVSMDWASVVARRSSKAPVAQGGWNIFSTTNVLSDVGDPVGFIGIAAGGDSAWFGWPDVPEIEADRLKFAQASDAKIAADAARDIQKLVVDNVVMVPLGEISNITVKSKKLTGQLPAEAPVFWNMEKAR